MSKRKRDWYRVVCDRCAHGFSSNFDHAGEKCSECDGHLKPYEYVGEIARLEVKSWTFIGSLGARHFYGKVSFRDEEYELVWHITAEEARLLNKHDGYNSYKKGDESSRFVSEEALIEAATNLYESKLKGLGCKLLLGDSSIPASVIAYDESNTAAAKKLAELSTEFEAIDGYEGDEDRADEISDEYTETLKNWKDD